MTKKSFGKEYNPNDFKQPEKEAGNDSKAGTYIGVAAVLIILIVGGAWWYMGSTKDQVGAAVINAYCVDSDGGYNRGTKGLTAGTYYLDYGEDEFVDKCAGDENKLTEYYCKNDLVVFTTEPCPEGQLCSDGVCV
jgi:hypothetical protein